jgi:2-oxoglutarate dehydrogenase E2 component (dihydrolipoamide succinyltransferase)
MPTEIKMPQLGESVTEGTVGKWLKQPGERVEKYEALLEVTTDKVDTEVPAPAAGVVRQIVVSEGQTVRVGTLLALLDDDGAADDRPFAAAQGRRPTTDPSLPLRAGDRRPTTDEEVHAGHATRNTQHATRNTQQVNTFISPVVARLAAEHNLDLGKIQGSGQGGRVTKQDVLKYIEARGKQATSEIAAEPPVAPRPEQEPRLRRSLGTGLDALLVDDVPSSAPAPVELPEDAELLPISPLRRTIAEHMVRSRRTAPHVTTVAEVDVSRISADRERRKADFERQGVRLTFTPYFVQASVAGLQAVPIVNASYADEGIVMHRRIHVGVAVALDEGLIVPVVRDADVKNLLGLARAVGDLSERARGRRLQPGETQGGTFTITNHGVGGSLFAMPIINQPQAAILGIGAIQKRAVVISQDGVDAIAIRPMCYLSLTFDHRLIDGATADQFMMAVKQFLEGHAE